VFSTAEDNQTSVDIKVVQGEREFAKDNKTLGQFRLEGIPAARRGVPQVEVTFDIDANGIVNVSAKDKGTGKEQRITITSSSGLSKEDIDRMVHEAQAHEAEDKKAREVVEKRNKLDGMILEIEKSISENKDKLDSAEVAVVQEEIAKAKDVLKDHPNDDEKLQKATDDLTQASYKIAEKLYQQQGGAQGQSPEKKDDEPIDAEISDK
jgi:molecular chaperone DnaK